MSDPTSECTNHIEALWNELEARNGTITSEEFMREHNFIYKKCIFNNSNMPALYQKIAEILPIKARYMDKDLFLLCAAHINSICAPVNRFHVPDGQPTIYQMALNTLQQQQQ
jgi:hypothetical protein